MMQVLYTAIFVGIDSFGFSQTRVVTLPRVVAALPMCLQVVVDGGSQVCELVYDFKLLVVDVDGWWNVHILTQHIGLFQADGQSEVFAGLGEPVYDALEFLLSVRGDRCIISKKHVPDGCLMHFGVCVQSSQVEKSTVRSGA